MCKDKGKQLRRWAGAGCAGLVLAVLLHDGHSPSVVQAQTYLGTAQSFGVLGGSTVTNTGSSVISGDLGVWPGLSITGFPPGVVVPPGTIHVGDAVAQQAQSDLTAAYDSLAGMACNTILTGQDLGGLTLTPGVYCFSSSAQLTGNLQLDAQGDSQAVFVFQIGSALTTATNSSVAVINGGQDCNVSWQVGTSATLGTATAFVGNILALQSITLTTGASLSGRALARNGAVTLDNNAITVPVCSFARTATPTAVPNDTPTPGPSPTPTAVPPTRTPTPGPSPTVTNTSPPGPSPTPGAVGGFGVGDIRSAQATDRVPAGNGGMPGIAVLVLAMLAAVVALAAFGVRDGR